MSEYTYFYGLSQLFTHLFKKTRKTTSAFYVIKHIFYTTAKKSHVNKEQQWTSTTRREQNYICQAFQAKYLHFVQHEPIISIKKPARLTASRGTIKEFFKTYTTRYGLDVLINS